MTVVIYKELIALRLEIGDCHACRLWSGRNNLVFGEGNCSSPLVVIGEGPGEQEDLTGRPFVGKSGELLEKALTLSQLSRNDVYITNIVKCRPPNNRDPREDEIYECSRFLDKQIKLLGPDCILALGRSASSHLLGRAVKITKERGVVGILHNWNIPVVPTYHPSFILRSFTQDKLDCLVKDIRLAWSVANGKTTGSDADTPT